MEMDGFVKAAFADEAPLFGQLVCGGRVGRGYKTDRADDVGDDVNRYDGHCEYVQRIQVWISSTGDKMLLLAGIWLVFIICNTIFKATILLTAAHVF